MGAFIRGYRQLYSLSLAQFASLLGVSISFLSDVEHGRRSVSIAKAFDWEPLLDMDPGDLIAIVVEDQIRRAGIHGLTVYVKVVK